MPSRPPARITRRYLWNVSQHQLARWATPTAHLRRLLMRRVDRSLAHHGGERAESEALVDEVLSELQRLGLLDDARYAASKVRGMLERGVSVRGIRGRLLAKGVPAEQIDQALAEAAEDGDPTLRACQAYARRRRLGPWRPEDQRAAERDRDLARLGRAGFPYGVAIRVLDGEPE